MEFDAYLDALASAEPAPGGGSAATLVGALAAALCAMVARITADAPRHADVREAALAVVRDADALRGAFLAARPVDEDAFRRVIAAQALPRGTDEERARRTAALQAALAGAAEAPLTAAALAVNACALAERAAALRNVHLGSDVACALHFAHATLAASGENVRVNHRYLHDADLVRAQCERLAALESRAAAYDTAARTLLAAS